MRRGQLFWGFLLILVGFAFLLDTLGILPGINIWSFIWPLVLISFGLWILWGSLFRRSPEQENVQLPLEGANRARVRLNHGAGRLLVSAGADAENLAEGEISGGVNLDTHRSGEVLDVRMSVPVQVFPFSWSPGYSLDWNIRFNHEVPIEMEVEAGANETHLDLSDLIVTDLRLNTGASRTMLTLPANAGYTRVSIKSGAASIDIAIPSGVEARILTRGGLSDIKIDSSRFTHSGNVFQSAGYAEAANKVDLDVEMGVGSVTVR